MVDTLESLGCCNCQQRKDYSQNSQLLQDYGKLMVRRDTTQKSNFFKGSTTKVRIAPLLPPYYLDLMEGVKILKVADSVSDPLHFDTDPVPGIVDPDPT